MIAYATADDLMVAGLPLSADELPDTLTDPQITALCGVASRQVKHATRFAHYDVDSAGKPDDPEVREAFKDATAAQVQTWIRLGLAPVVLSDGLVTPGTNREISSKSMGGRSVSYVTTTPEEATARRAVLVGLGTVAQGFLQDAGLDLSLAVSRRW